jgi:hypothetical protein
MKNRFDFFVSPDLVYDFEDHREIPYMCCCCYLYRVIMYHWNRIEGIDNKDA